MAYKLRIGKTCKVPKCYNCYYKNYDNNMRFFSFPKDTALRKAWKEFCEITDSVKFDNYYICETHFERKYILSNRRLWKGTIPTLRVGEETIPIGKETEGPVSTGTVADISNVEENHGEKHELLQPLDFGGSKFLDPSSNSTKQNENNAEYSTEVVEDASDLQLVEEHELLQNLNFYDAKFLDLPDDSIPDANHEVPTELEKPYFKSVKSFLKDTNRMTEVCRICFQSLEEEEVIKLYEQSCQTDPVQIKMLLKLVLPELDLEIYPNAVICVKCSELLVYSYQLKEKWLSTEEKLAKLIKKKKSVLDRNADLVIIGKKIETDHAYAERPSDENSAWGDTLLESISAGSEETSLPKKVSIFYGNFSSDDPFPIKTFKKSTTEQEKNKEMEELQPYMCEKCGRTYKFRSEFQDHLNIHENSKHTVMCEICGELICNIRGLKRHKTKHLERKCDFCDRIFDSQCLLRAHISSTHSTSHQCHLCGKTFAHLSSLLRHVVRHNPANKTKVCHVCGKQFFYLFQLKLHLRKHDTKTFLKCPYCAKSIKHRRALEAHMKTHSKKIKYTCEICNKEFSWKNTWQRHNRKYHQSQQPLLVEESTELFNESNCAGYVLQQILTLEH